MLPRRAAGDRPAGRLARLAARRQSLSRFLALTLGARTCIAPPRLQRESVHDITVGQPLINPRMIGLSLVYLGAVATNYGLGFLLPQIVKTFGLDTFMTTVVSATPYAAWLVAKVWWGRRSGHKAERRHHTAIPLFVAAAGIAASTALEDSMLKVIAFCIAGFGIFSCLPVFVTLPTAFLSGAAAAAGIAVINSIGNLAGFAGPFAMGWIKDHTASYTGGPCCSPASASSPWASC